MKIANELRIRFVNIPTPENAVKSIKIIGRFLTRFLKNRTISVVFMAVVTKTKKANSLEIILHITASSLKLGSNEKYSDL